MANSQICKKDFNCAAEVNSHVLNICFVDRNPTRVILQKRGAFYSASPKEHFAFEGWLEGLGLPGLATPRQEKK